MDILTVSRQWLELNFDSKTSRLEFPPEVVANCEIVDNSAFSKLVNDFLDTLGFRNRRVKVVLLSDMVFEKSFPKTPGDNNNEEIKKFYEEIPFLPEKVLKKEYSQGETITAIAVNNEILQIIVSALKLRSDTIVAVAPESLSKTNANLLGNNSPSFRAGFNKRVIVILVLVLILLTALGLLGFNYFFKKAPSTTPPPVLETDTLETKVATQEAMVTEFKKRDELKIKVLNGTGKAGEAGKVKTALEKAGFVLIETENASSKSAVTTVNFGEMVSATDSAVIIDILAKLFESVVSTVSAELTNDVEIITGK